MTQTLYNTDFYKWTQQQAELLHVEEFESLDLPNLIEEIEAMGRSERRELTSRLLVLLMHLLKWEYQPTLHGHTQPKSWRNTIRTQRNRIEIVLGDSPSLRRELPDCVVYAYPRARSGASEETELPLNIFPDTCPYTIDQILDTNWLPG